MTEEKRSSLPEFSYTDSTYNGFSKTEGLEFIIDNSVVTLKFANGQEISISNDEFAMCREGDIPKSIRTIANDLGFGTETVVRASRAAILPEITTYVSKKDSLSGFIRNGPEGLVQWRKEAPTKDGDPPRLITIDLIRFDGYLGPACLIDEETRGIGLVLNGTQYSPMPLGDFYSLIRQELSVPPQTMQKLKEVLNAWVRETIENKQAVDYRSSPIYVKSGQIKIDFQHVGDPRDILYQLREFEENASNPLAYRTVLAWALLAPLHDDLKRNANVARRIQAPELMFVGKTQSGKTPLGDFMIGKGYAMRKDAYFYPYQTIRTTFTLMRHLGETNLPAMFDDLSSDWLLQHSDDLKAYVQTGHFGDRGRSDQTIREYRGRRSFIGTVNGSIRIDDDLATSMRIIILKFTEKHRRRKNLEAWNALIDAIPDGFLFEIFRVLFEEQSILSIAKDVENFRSPTDWINYIIKKLNQLSQWYGLREWPLFSEDEDIDDDSNALEVAQSFLAEWERIERNEENSYDRETDTPMKVAKYRSPIEGEFKVETKDQRKYIWFTGPAFKTIVARQNLKLPYRNAVDFLNNVANQDYGVRVENEGQGKSHRVGDLVLKMYCLSVPIESEPDE
jgi:hypothetical protein